MRRLLRVRHAPTEAVRAAPDNGREARVSAVAIVVGAGADLLLGDPPRWHPVAGFGRAAAALERIVYRPTLRAGAVHAGLLAVAVAAERGSSPLPRR